VAVRVLFAGGYRSADVVEALLEQCAQARTYKRDADGRFGSGGGTGGGGVRDALSGHETAEALGAAASAEAKRITGNDVEFDFGDTDPQIAAEHAEGILQGLERFPGTFLKRVEVTDLPAGQYGECRTDTRSGESVIQFSRQASSDPEMYREKLAKGGKMRRMGRDTVYSDPTTVALHEFGHSVASGSGANAGSAAIASRWRDKQAAAAVERGYYDKPGADAKAWTDQRMEISVYAGGRDSELAAEAFADVMRNGDSASGLSKEVFDYVETRSANP